MLTRNGKYEFFIESCDGVLTPIAKKGKYCFNLGNKHYRHELVNNCGHIDERKSLELIQNLTK